MMNAFVAVTDRAWFEQLAQGREIDEVNFWQPSADHAFQALQQGELFLFKLHSPDDFIVGGGFFSYWTSLPVSYAWEAFEIKNGAATLSEMRTRIERYRHTRPAPHEDYKIGCILLQQPFFLTREEWLPVPDWHRSIVRGKTYPLAEEPGRTLWREITLRLWTRKTLLGEVPERRYGEPVLVRPRLGQGSFRVLVTDAYRRQCAVTSEKALPVLQAVHIRSFADGGEHRVDNGLLLRSDLHILFDRGYMTVTPEYRLEVSRRLRTDFDNGEEYLSWHGGTVWVPAKPALRPKPEFLSWHNEHRFVG